MHQVQYVDVPRRPVAALEEVIGLPRTTRLLAAAADFRKVAGGRVVWNFGSTATGGGGFFRVTKRLHNRIHGQAGDGALSGRRNSAISAT